MFVFFFAPLRHQSPLCVSCRSPSLSEMPLGSVLGRRPTCHRNICTKVLLAEGAETPFTEHCRNYENTYRVSALNSRTLSRLLLKHFSLFQSDLTSIRCTYLIVGADSVNKYLSSSARRCVSLCPALKAPVTQSSVQFFRTLVLQEFCHKSANLKIKNFNLMKSWNAINVLHLIPWRS